MIIIMSMSFNYVDGSSVTLYLCFGLVDASETQSVGDA